jgi:RES domain-containing protein/HEPN superfamily RES-like protein
MAKRSASPSAVSAGEDVGENRICWKCIGEDYLSAEVKREGDKEVCSYCGHTRRSISIEQLSDRIDTALKEHYRRTASEPDDFESMMMRDGDYSWQREGDRVTTVIRDAAGIKEKPAEHVRQILEERHHHARHKDEEWVSENPFGDEAHYEEKDVDDEEFQVEWFAFRRSLRTEARLFNQAAERVLDSIFDGLATHRTHNREPVLVDAGPGQALSALYRARPFQSDDDLDEALKRPDRELAAPPPHLAKAGRMNAHGIAVFYGATEAEVARAEIRPSVGSKVLIGKFAIIRALRLLDVEALRSIFVDGSIFDPAFLQRRKKAKFLESLSERITQPVMPDDEPFEYLVTQAIADYLATRGDPACDGIIYASAQDGKEKKNVVLFHKAARVESLDIPEGTDIAVRTWSADDDPEPEYCVYESVPPKPKEKDPPFITPLRARRMDKRTPTLRIDLTSIAVHHIKGVEVRADAYEVTRQRSKKTKWSRRAAQRRRVL